MGRHGHRASVRWHTHRNCLRRHGHRTSVWWHGHMASVWRHGHRAAMWMNGHRTSMWRHARRKGLWLCMMGVMAVVWLGLWGHSSPVWMVVCRISVGPRNLGPMRPVVVRSLQEVCLAGVRNRLQWTCQHRGLIIFGAARQHSKGSEIQTLV